MKAIVSDLIKQYLNCSLTASEIRDRLVLDSFEFKFSVPTLAEVRKEIEKVNNKPIHDELKGLLVMAREGFYQSWIQGQKDLQRFDSLERSTLSGIRADETCEPGDEAKRALAISSKHKDESLKTSTILKNYVDCLLKLNQIGLSEVSDLPEEDRAVNITFEVLQRKDPIE